MCVAFEHPLSCTGSLQDDKQYTLDCVCSYGIGSVCIHTTDLWLCVEHVDGVYIYIHTL